MTDAGRMDMPGLAGWTIPGVRNGRIVRHGDERGSFREIWRASWYGDAHEDAEDGPRFVQANVSVSARGVLRGLHMHRRQVDHWVVLEGRAAAALVDVRPVLSSSGRPMVEVREMGPDDWLAIPIGVAHGFLALEALTLLYLVSGEYDGSDELGFAWDDPAVAVPWPPAPGSPDGRPILSGRDEGASSLADLVERLRA
jgi:dTDP-4-dehydrorhamnose 3,5-epimerase